MKKRTLRIISLLLSALMLTAILSLPAFAAEQLTVKVEEGTEDVLDHLLTLTYCSPKNEGKIMMNSCVVDGIFAVEHESKCYFNNAFCTNGDQESIEESGGTFEFVLTDGSTKKYLYSINFELFDYTADVDSFALYFNNERSYDIGSEYGETFPFYHIDAEFEILVSQDGGQTYTIAWESVPYEVSPDGTTLLSCAGLLESEGGNMTEEKVFNEAGTYVCTYRYVADDLKQKFEGVTNIIYACEKLRRTGYTDFAPFYFAARISEFDVYGSKTMLETEPVSEQPTDAPDPEIPTEASAAPTDPAAQPTEAPTDGSTWTTENTNTPETKAVEEKKGCGSSASAIVLIALLGSGVTVLRKKH